MKRDVPNIASLCWAMDMFALKPSKGVPVVTCASCWRLGAPFNGVQYGEYGTMPSFLTMAESDKPYVGPHADDKLNSRL